MKPMELAYKLAQMSAETQNRFFAELEATQALTEDELNSMMIVVAYLSMEMNPEKKQAVMTAMAEKLYNEFNAGA